MAARIVNYVKAHWQYLLNVYLFLNFLGWTGFQGYRLFTTDRLYFSEVAFLAQNVALTAVVILRMPHRAMEKSLWSQIVAATAFFSGAAFMGQAPTGGPLALAVSESIMILSAALGIATVLSLGKSFGILIAVREVRSSGPYSLVRHPMYVTDILLRIGFTVNHFTAFTAVLLVLTSACYVYRALLEEKFLGRFPDYREYMARVRRRFIPLVF